MQVQGRFDKSRPCLIGWKIVAKSSTSGKSTSFKIETIMVRETILSIAKSAKEKTFKDVTIRESQTTCQVEQK